MEKDEIFYDDHGNPIRVLYKDEVGVKIDEETDTLNTDKIFGNAYNAGDTVYAELPDIQADTDWASKNLQHVYASDDYHTEMKLYDLCHTTFNKSQWSELPLDKKFPKDLMPYIFNDLFTAMDNKGFTVFDIFITIAEFMGCSYEKVYWSAGVRVQERLIYECNKKFGSLDNKQTNRLF